jgi:predicted MPP superfamily phosphohydrolase
LNFEVSPHRDAPFAQEIEHSLKSRIAVFIVIIQTILLFGHWFLYETLAAFFPTPDGRPRFWLGLTLALLSVSFVAASLLAWQSFNIAVRVFYSIAAVWMGILNFCFLAAGSCWILWGVAHLTGLHPDRRLLATVIFGIALATSLYGLVNAAWTRVTRVTVRLPNLPASWRGRIAALVSDTHLGHVRGHRFLRRIVTMLNRLQPDIVMIAGDVYDGTVADLNWLAAPLKKLTAPLGAFFVAGNHEEFSDPAKYLNAVNRVGVRVLKNEKVVVDGLQIVGIDYRDSVNDDHFRNMIRRAAVDRTQASILLTHAPDRVKISQEEGLSLQLSGHTHGGQLFPFTWITKRIYGKFVYGLQRLGDFLVYTSYGAGTWGPPLRVGTKPEIVLIQFE